MGKARPAASEVFDIVSIPTINPKTHKKVNQTYAISLVRKLGEGTSGTVYEAELRDRKDPTKSHGKVAIKLYKDPGSFEERELKELSKFYFAQKQQKGNDVYLITQLLPGHELRSDKSVVHPDLDKLTFAQRINLITQIVTQFNLLHHETAYKGAAMVHGDIKGANIRVFIDPKTGKTEAYPIDFGLTKELKEQDADKKAAVTFVGNPVYFPHEAMSSQVGIKTDIYMLVAPILTILGETDPYKDKIKEADDIKASQTSYHIDLTKVTFPDFLPGIDVRSLTTAVLMLAQNAQYHLRPDSDEMLRYFMTLNQLVQTHENNPKDVDAKTILIAKLAILASGMWNEEISTTKVNKLNKKGKIIGVETIAQTYADFDFSAHPQTCANIVEATRRGVLDSYDVKAMIAWEEGAINFEYNAKILQVRLQTLTDQLALTPTTTNAHKLWQEANDITKEFNAVIDEYAKSKNVKIDKIAELQQRLSYALDEALVSETAKKSKLSMFDKSDKRLISVVKEVSPKSPLLKKMDDIDEVAKIPLSPVQVKTPSPRFKN